MQTHLIVHQKSVPYIRGIIGFLRAELAAQYGDLSYHEVTQTLDEIPLDPPSRVFFIGERLAPFTRQPGAKYGYFNFSVVTMLGSPFACSLSGLRLIAKKRRLLAAKAAQADAVFDYYPAQTHAIGALGFLPASATAAEPPLPPDERSYDVCFVGGISKRRAEVLEQVRSAGLSLSPSSGADLESLSRDSRICLNIHMQRSNHLEIPRIVGALSTGTPVLSETSFGLGDIIQDEVVIEARLGDLAQRAKEMISDPERLSDLAARAAKEYARYLDRARRLLRTSLDAFDGAVTQPQAAFARPTRR